MKLTVSRAWLMHEADSIEQSASSSLRAWILLDQSERFGDEMAKARKLRQAADVKSIAERRERVRELGYNV